MLAQQGGDMRRPMTLFGAALVALGIAVAGSALAQSTPSQEEPAQATRTVPTTPSAKELEGKDAFSSDSQQLGKVTKANTLSDGNVKDIEIQSSGFLGFFSKTYVVPVEKAAVKGGRVEVTMTNDQVKQLAK
jgi:PRC-barrel domain